MPSADFINNQIRRALIDEGFKGIIPIGEARKIIRKVLTELNITSHKVSVEPSPIHTVGGPMRCDCKSTVIKVESKVRVK